MPCTKTALVDCPLTCLFSGFCKKTLTPIVTDVELDNSQFIRHVRETAYDEHISDSDWHEHVTNLYRDMRGWVVDEESAGKDEVLLDMREFDVPSIREWFRDWCCEACPPEVTPRVRPEARERVRVLATILRGTHPVRASLWGVRPANDNRPTQPQD